MAVTYVLTQKGNPSNPISVSGDGAETAEKYHPSMIKTKKVVFRSGIDLKEIMLKEFSSK